MNIVIIVFAGNGSRIKSEMPKQFIKVKNQELFLHSVKIFQEHPQIDSIVLVTNGFFVDHVKRLIKKESLSKVKEVLEGGVNRQDSVRIGLEAVIFNDDDKVLIHDGDRPLVNQDLITRLLKGLEDNTSSIPILKKSDEMEGSDNLGREITIDGEVYDVQTPQCFSANLIKTIHHRLIGEDYPDDASMMEALNGKVTYISGDKYNFKITTIRDLEFFTSII